MTRPSDIHKTGLCAGLFNDSFPPVMDGVAMTVYNYAYWMDRMGHKPVVVTPNMPDMTPQPFDVVSYFSLPIPHRKPYRYGYPNCDLAIWREMRHREFDIVHTHSPFSAGKLAAYAARKRGVPLIATLHSKYKDDLRQGLKYTPWIIRNSMRKMLELFNACDEVWIPQAAVEETAREYGYKGPLTVVDNGTDMMAGPDFDIGGFRAESRKKCGIKTETLSLIFVGQHIWDKGIGIIAEALALIKGEIDFTMHFIGTGYALQPLREMVHRLGLDDCVTIHGPITDREEMTRRYAAADLFLFPSYYDNAPLVVREAASQSVPAIIPIGSTTSEVITDGENGFLTQRTPQAYADALRHLSAHREKIAYAGRNARATLTRSWADIAEEVADRYKTLISIHRHGSR